MKNHVQPDSDTNTKTSNAKTARTARGISHQSRNIARDIGPRERASSAANFKLRHYPLSGLRERMMCPHCGNRRVNLIFEPPPAAKRARTMVRSTPANARSPPWPPAHTGSPCRNTPPNSMKSSRSGAISRPITSPTRPSQTSPPSTKPSMTPSSISTASASPIRWPCQESLLRKHRRGQSRHAAWVVRSSMT